MDDEMPELGISVLGEFRGEGIGTALMRELEVQARNYGYKKLCLSVDPTNPARRLYERFEYVHVGWCDTSWTMEKHLV
ncbi:N-acetyltransferase [Alicyclobacillus sp. SP_1]|uniref:GNAT family N-acetyltransferase n=1 Tax=Alicyclobacillus sp. SP_1 TaxID=2942475 RepID=UPI0021570324|nr:GNAT family N-acetyltransferase [Alicyclobacillus sp. SP_1]